VIDERNDVVHQLWIYEHRSNARVLRKTLEMLAKVARQLARASLRVTNEIGLEEVYEIEL
jgi:hypothetical protein